MANLATLGFEFETGGAAQAIDALIEKIEKLRQSGENVSSVLGESFDKNFSLKINFTENDVSALGKLFTVLKDAPQNVPDDLGAKISSIAVGTSGLKPISKETINGLQNLFIAIKSVPQNNIHSNISLSLSAIANATNNMKPIKKSVTDGIQNLFNAMRNIPQIDPNKIQSLSQVMTLLSSVNLKGVSSAKTTGIQNLLNAFSNMKPLSGDVINSIQQITRLLNALGTVTKNTHRDVNSFNNVLGTMGGHADAAAIAFRSFTGAFSVNFLKNASMDANEFGKELAYIKSLAMEFDTNKIGAGIMNYSSLLGEGAKNAKALYYAYSSGVRGSEDDLVSFTEIMGQLATVIRADVVPTMDAATTMMNSYGLSARDAAEISDVMFNIVKYGKAKGEQLASGLGQVISTSATAGVSLNEMGAAIASLTKVMQTRNAITYFNNMLSKMIKPTKESRLAAEALGIELGVDAVRAKGFAAVMQEIHDKTKGSHDALLKIFPDLRGQRAALQLLNVGWNDFNMQLKNFKNGGGAAAEAFNKLNYNTEVQLGALPVTFQKITQESGRMFNSIVTFGGAFTPAVAAFNNMNESTRKLIASTTLLVAAFGIIKASKVAYTALQAMEIRNNNIIIAQQAMLAKTKAADSSIKAAGFSVNFMDAFNMKGTAFRQLEVYFRALNMKIHKLGLVAAFTSGTVSILTIGLSALGKILGTAAVAVAGFALKAIMIAGPIIAAAVAIDNIVHGFNQMELVTTRLLEMLVVKLTNVKEISDKVEQSMKDRMSLRAEIRDNKGWAKRIQDDYNKQYDDIWKDKNPAENPLIKAVKNYNEAVKKLNSAEGKAAEENLAKKEKEFDTAAKRYEAVKQRYEQATRAGNTTSDLETELKNAEENYNNAKSAKDRAQKAYTGFMNSIITAGKDLKKVYDELQHALDNIKNLLENQKFKFMSDTEKYKYVSDKKDNSLKDYLKYMKDGPQNAKLAEGALKSYLDSLNYMIQENEKKIKEYKDILERVNEAGWQDKYNFSDDATKKRMLESKIDKGDYDMSFGKTTEERAKGFNDWRNFSLMRLNLLKQEAQAEAQANQSLVNMIAQMDKFKTTAVKAVDVQSSEAVDLQSRRFDDIPQLDFNTNSQAQYEQEKAQYMQDLNQHVQYMNESIGKLLNVAQNNVNDLKNEFRNTMKTSEGYLKNLDTNLNKIANGGKGKSEIIIVNP